MSRIARKYLTTKVVLSIMGAAALGLLLIPDPGESAASPTLQDVPFMGGVPSRLDLEGLQTSRLEFPAGSRSNWHTHTDGQLLMVEEGLGRTQVRGGPIEVKRPGEPWYTSEGVEHWHGAAPDQNAIQLTIYAGEVNWLEPVTDDEYMAEVSN